MSISRGMAQRSGSHACLRILWDLVTILIPGPHPRPPAAASPGWSLETSIFSEGIITSNSAFVYLFMSIYSASPRGTEAPCGRRLQLVPHTLNTGPGSLTLNRRMGRRRATETRSQAREPLSGPSPSSRQGHRCGTRMSSFRQQRERSEGGGTRAGRGSTLAWRACCAPGPAAHGAWGPDPALGGRLGETEPSQSLSQTTHPGPAQGKGVFSARRMGEWYILCVQYNHPHVRWEVRTRRIN